MGTGSGEYRGVYWYRHHWGLELVRYTDNDTRLTARYVGNGSDPVTVRESVRHWLADS